MELIWDKYFFTTLGVIVVSALFIAVAVRLCFKYPRFGRVAFAVFLVVGYSYPLVQCTNVVAHSFRPTIESKGEKP